MRGGMTPGGADPLHLLLAAGLLFVATEAFGEEVPRSGEGYGLLLLSAASIADDTVMDEMRGGLRIGGLDMSFGASLRTALDNEPLLHTLVTFTGDQLTPVMSVMAAPDASTLRHGLSDGISMPGLEGSVGASIVDRRGTTSVLHQVTRTRLVSVLAHRASGRRVSHRVNLSVNVDNFSRFQQMSRSSLLARGISGPLLSR